MNTALWIVQSVLALLFLFWGIIISTQPKDKVAEHGPWVENFSSGQVRSIGMLEILGAVGLILPALTGIFPVLTPVAAAGLAMTMVGAMIIQLQRQDRSATILVVVLLAATVFVAFGRFLMVPFS